jgi:hypothetical protein
LGFACAYTQTNSSTIVVGQDYLGILEERLRSVEAKLDSLTTSNATGLVNMVASITPQSYATVEDGVETTNAADADRAVVLAAEPNKGFFGPTSNIALVRQVAKAVSERALPSPTLIPADTATTTLLARAPNPARPIDAYEVPPFHVLHSRIEHYFRWTAVLYPFIHRDSFMSNLEGLRESARKVSRPFLGIVNMMLALAHNIPVSENIEEGELYYHRAQLLCDQNTLDNVSLEVVQYLLILSQYLQGAQQTIKAWTVHGVAVKAAMQIGLHSSEVLKELSPIDQEIRKRTWYITAMLDRHLSISFGRPMTVPDNHVRLPPVKPFSDYPEAHEQDSVDFMNGTM